MGRSISGYALSMVGFSFLLWTVAVGQTSGGADNAVGARRPVIYVMPNAVANSNTLSGAGAPGLPIALGVVPFVFSIALFLLPIGRALLRGRRAKAVARENGRRALLREILTNVGRAPITEEELRRAWKGASGEAPSGKQITREVVALGGDVDIEGGANIRYRFPDLEAEASTLEAERAAASEEEARVGRVKIDASTRRPSAGCSFPSASACSGSHA